MTHYTVPVGTDLQQVVRKYYLNAGVPAPGLTVGYVVRDASGTALAQGNLAEVNSAVAPGWYYLPASQVIDMGGPYTIEYTPPVGFSADGDTIFISSPIGQAKSDFVRGG